VNRVTPCKRAGTRLVALLALGCGACHGPAETVVPCPLAPVAAAARAVPATDAKPRALPDVVARVRPCVVSVLTSRTVEAEAGVGLVAREHALGSGFLIGADGLMVTSRHVIDGADEVRVVLDDGRSFPGAVVARDALLDVALLRLQGARGLPTVTLGSSAGLRAGDTVIAIGNPFGLGPSVTVGILSATARSLEEGPLGRLLQTDAAVNPGYSGGPLLDGEGRVVGINTAVLDHGQGITFAVPIDDVRAVLAELSSTGRVARGRAGLSYQTVDGPLARALLLAGPAGALVTEIEAGSPAQRAGVRPGDLITAVEGRAVRSAGDLDHELAHHKPGEVVHFAVRRGACARLPVTLAIPLDRLVNRDGDAESRPVPPAPRAKGATGLRLTDADGGGARVDALDPGSSASDVLRPGDVLVEVDRAPIHDAADAARRLAPGGRHASLGGSHTALLRLRRGSSFLYVGIDLT
jgi:serine protease Do